MAPLFSHPFPPPSPLRAAISAAHLEDEAACVDRLLHRAALDGAAQWRVEGAAARLVRAAREQRLAYSGLDAFLHEYDLSSQEGVVLMCLAEALLRIPDADTADRLIRDKFTDTDWFRHLGHSRSLLVNASTWGLMLTGGMVKLEEDVGSFFGRFLAKSGEPVVRLALTEAMHILAGQFVMGSTIEEALERSRRAECLPYRFSFDMLGEAALTRADGERYFRAYAHALETLAAANGRAEEERHGISVKLSALHPRFEYAQKERVMAELVPTLRELAEIAAKADLGLTVDAEEADRLELTLDVFEAVFREPAFRGWQGFGLAVQAYQKRAIPVLEWLADLARDGGRRIPVRLVKGAYWDTEIKRAQVQGLASYPVFTRKEATDVSYLAGVRCLFANQDALYPQFATHNAHTLAYVLEVAGQSRDFEFQRLYGMGDALYAQVVGADKTNVACRVYAPVGSHRELLPYMVRRLLENGANTSFVNRVVEEGIPAEQVAADPVPRLRLTEPKPHPRIPLPRDLYGEWRNSEGYPLDEPAALAALEQDVSRALERNWHAAPLVGGEVLPGKTRPVLDPADRRRIVGEVAEADEAALEKALSLAYAAASGWDATPAEERAAALERAAGLVEAHRAEFVALLAREAGRCTPDGLAEVREAADYCRYYAHLARRDFGEGMKLPGPAGESNRLRLHGRGVFACISPWNFPLAIFTGQVAAALAAGNAVVAKPAGATPLAAMLATRLLLDAGVPENALHLLPGAGSTVGLRLASDPRVAGVAFTGSTDTAKAIHRALAAREGAIPALIAETGGLNALVADSSALLQQVVSDTLQSAFNSAGQRCSALRVLFVQEEVADRLIELLVGAMAELAIGDPLTLSTDLGPAINQEAKTALERHAGRMAGEGRRLLYRAPLPPGTEHGSFFPPHLYELPSLDVLKGEVFGPMLHLIRYPADGLDAVIDRINRTGYGLTFGLHSRIDATIEHVTRRVRAGNLYVNRNMVGAVVGVQPFGGEGLSGTGPKAGGPHYLHRFAVERAAAVNTMAVGGNAALLTTGEGKGG